jgi:hypothetical protein
MEYNRGSEHWQTPSFKISMYTDAVYHTYKLKRTVQRDFLTPVFFTKLIILVSIDMPKNDFEICQILVELFVLKLSKNRLQKQSLR